jgi:protein STU2
VLDEIQEGMRHKNPQVKTESLKFLVRCLRTTPFAPTKGEITSIGESCTKLLGENFEPVRQAAQEALGTLMKIVGERAMIQFLDGVDDIRKAKIKEFFEKAEIKARARPEPKAAPAKTRPAAVSGGNTGPRPSSMRPGAAKPAPLKRPSSTISVDKDLDSPKKPTIARPSSMKPPATTSRLAHRQSVVPPARTASPTHAPAPKKPVVEDPPAAPKLGRGLMGRVRHLKTPLIIDCYNTDGTTHDESRTCRIRYPPCRKVKMGNTKRRRSSRTSANLTRSK